MHTKSNMAYVLPSLMPFCLVITTLAKLSFLMPTNQLEGSCIPQMPSCIILQSLAALSIPYLLFKILKPLYTFIESKAISQIESFFSF